MTHKKRGGLFAFLVVLALVMSYLIFVYFYDREMTDYGRDSNYLSNRGYARALGLSDFKYDSILKRLGSPVKTTVLPEANELGNTLVFLE